MWNNNIGWKKKLVYTIVVIALVITQGYLLVGFEIQGWNTAIELTTYLFNKPVEDSQIKVPHAQDTYENLIRWTFGKDYKLALAVATAENGTHDCQRVHVNKDGSRDIGIFQINTVHANKGFDLYDCKSNVLLAYQLFKRSGFAPWVAYQNKSYLKFL